MKFIAFPTARVAELTIRIVQHPISIKFTACIELSFILCPIGEDMLPVCLSTEILQRKIIDGLFCRVHCLDLADGRTFGLMGLVQHVYWGLELLQLKFVGKAAFILKTKG